MITRRGFVRRLIGFALIAAHPFRLAGYAQLSPVQALDSKGPAKKTIGDYFAGEELEYEVSFWFLKRVATAKMRFARLPEKGHFVATLQGETVGLVGWLTSYRVDSYRAVMEEVDGGARLRSISLEEYVKIGAKVRQNIHHFDHAKRTWVHETSRKNGTMRRYEHAIPEGKSYDDFVTASYNFRYQVYGRIERGKRFVVPTFPRKGASSYEIKMAPKDEEETRRKAENPGKDGVFFITLTLDPDVVNSKEGVIEGWLSNDLYPVAGTIKDAILFGDVKGRLLKRTIADKI
jgi:hypothetical protein